MTAPAPGRTRDLYDLLTGDDEARVCKDIPDAACREQPRSFFIHGLSLVLASGIAGGLSSAVWGRFSDRSSRLVMMASGGIAGLTAFGTGVMALTVPELLGLPLVIPAAIFLVALAHAGMRIGRKTYLVDLAGGDRRAGYVALSNTLIGVVLLLSGLVGVLAERAGVGLTLVLLAACSGLGVWLAYGLPEVQED